MTYQEIVSSLEREVQEHQGERLAELLARAALAITALDNRNMALEHEIELLLDQIANLRIQLK